MSTLKNMKTAPRTWKGEGNRICSRGAGGPPAMANGKWITREKANVFHNLTPAVNSTSGGQLERWRNAG